MDDSFWEYLKENWAFFAVTAFVELGALIFVVLLVLYAIKFVFNL